MSYFASCGGFQIVDGSLMIPSVGIWSADISISTQNELSGSVSVVLGNLTLQGFVLRSVPFAGQTRARIVGGFGGWRNEVSAQAYGSGSGVKLSTVVKDVASACGEKVNVASDKPIGSAYTRLDAPASDVLWTLVALGVIPGWHVDASGTTQLIAWPASTVQTPFTVVDQKPDDGLVTIATEDYASWVPGCSFSAPTLDGTFTSSGVTYRFDADGQFRLEILTSDPGSNRLLEAFQQLVKQVTAPLRFHGRYKYTISNPTESSIDGRPVDQTLGLPEVQKVPLVGDSIATYLPPNGGEAHIQFIDGNPNDPRCVWTEGAPQHAELLGGTMQVARIGDTVQTMVTGAGTALSGCLFQFAGPAGAGGAMLVGSPYTLVPVSIFQITTACSGTITTGSNTVKTQ